jgi:sugar-specific transcriptional regulator TrmB
MNPNLLIERLCQFGFSGYEARAYVTLLKCNPVTGYEMAKNSGIPPSKIYEIINKLMVRSMITPITGNPIKYLPQNSKLFLKKLRHDFEDTLDYLEEHMPNKPDNEFDYIWNINTAQELIGKAQELIKQASSEIILLAWDQELKELLPVIKKLLRKVKIAVIQFGIMEIPCRPLFRHRIPDIIAHEKGGNELTMVVDNSVLLQGLLSQSGTVNGIYTSNPSLVQVALDYMKHEIYTNKIFNTFEKVLFREYGENLEKLRDIWSS